MHDKVSSRQTKSNVSLEPTCSESTDADDSTTTELLSKGEPVKGKIQKFHMGRGKGQSKIWDWQLMPCYSQLSRIFHKMRKKILRHPLMKMLIPSSAGAVSTP